MPAPSSPDPVVPVSDPVPDLVAAAWAIDPNHDGGLSDRPQPHRDKADERIPNMYVERAQPPSLRQERMSWAGFADTFDGQ